MCGAGARWATASGTRTTTAFGSAEEAQGRPSDHVVGLA